jgi:hypothetical protein
MNEFSEPVQLSPRMPLRTYVLTAVMLMTLACASGCGAGANRTATSTTQIKQEWAEFFSPTTPASKKIQLVQNGQQLAPVIRTEANSPLATQTQAIVTRVVMQGPDRATVLYTLNLAGRPVLQNQAGTAVKVGGKWRISDQSLCALLRLEGSAPPICSGTA